MSSWTSIAGSWGCFAGCVVLGWYYYKKDGSQPKRIDKQQVNGSITDVLQEIVPQEQKKKQKKKKSPKDEASATTSDRDSNVASTSIPSVKAAEPALQNRKKTTTNKTAQSSSVDANPVSTNGVSKESDTDIKEFARQMAKAKTGTTFSSSGKDVQRVRTKKQSKISGSFAAEPDNSETIASGTSSNAGGDADDDVSSVNSPGLNAIPPPADKTGVADMLEPVGPGPVSLRITEPLVPVRERKSQVKKEQVVETKKQRQNRLKREREREANREAEAQRKILEEKQRRIAREAEGRPAKNGNGWTYDSGLPANAWSSGKTKSTEPPATQGGLLDTFEDTPKIPSIVDSSAPLVNRKTNGINGSTADWNNELPSEEEQLRIIQEQGEDAEWTTVSQPKRGKRKE